MSLHPASVAIVRSEGAIDVTFDRLETPRTLFVAEMFRPAWAAGAANQGVSLFAFLDSLLAIRVPTGATSVHFAYRPGLMYAATVGALATIAASLLGVILLSR